MRRSICVTIEHQILHELSIRHIKNVSGLINDLLKSYLQIKDDDTIFQEQILEEQLNKKKAELMQLEEQKAELIKRREDESEKVKKQIESGELLVIE